MKAIREKRELKVYGQSGYKYQDTPTIMLKGKWLEEAGFDIGQPISANYAQTECQFRYCGTAIPFLTVRSTAR